MKIRRVDIPMGGRNFNISVVGGVSVWRHESEGGETSLMYGGLIGSSIKYWHRVPLGNPHATGFEDPRIFFHNKLPWLSFVASCYINGAHYASQGVIRFQEEDFQENRWLYPDWGKNRNQVSCGNGVLSREKNWTFFSWENKIHVLYSINPLRVGVMDERTGDIETIYEIRADVKWPWGEIHGGTGLVQVDGKLLGCFHSFTRGPKQRDYHVGWYLIDPETWKLVAISPEPWMSSERDEERDLRPKTQKWRPNVVFPCGLELNRGELSISYGWQDCRSMLATESLDVVMKSLVRVSTHYRLKECIRDKYTAPRGGLLAIINGQPHRGAHWKQLVRLTKSTNISEEALEEAVCLNLPNHYKDTKWQSYR
jgi:predicted GH43/DUF377 family glycosyl hydrolase